MIPVFLIPVAIAFQAHATPPIGGGTEPAHKPQGIHEATAPQTPAPDAPPGDRTDQEMLRTLQRRRPMTTVIPPASTANRENAPPQVKLLPEGSTVVEQRGSLRSDHGGWWFHRDDAKEGPPLRLLPNATLELMIGTTDGARKPIAFVVSGEVTVYERENYLVASAAVRAFAPAVRTIAEPPITPGVATDAPVDDILKLLESRDPPQKMITPGTAEAPSGPTHRVPPSAAPMLDGTPIVSRPGRLVRTGADWSFFFESAQGEKAEAPLRILPNQNLEFMVRMSARDTTGLVFFVSGEVTSFEGQNHLLARSAVRRIDLGNLSK